MLNDLLMTANGVVGQQSTPTVDLTQGLVAHYLLNNNADDSYGTYEGTASSGVEFSGDMANFIADADTVDATLSSLSSHSFTFSLWARTNNTGTDKNPAGYLSMYSQGDFIGMAMGYTEYNKLSSVHELVLIIRDGTTQDALTVEVNRAINVASLHHIVGTSDGTNLKLYYDGVLIGTLPITSNSVNRTVLAIAQYFTNYDNFRYNFEGDMSNVRIYNEAKDQTFINALYAEGYYPKPLPLPTTTGLVAHYPLTGTAEDETGNYDGTENGGLTYVDDAEFGSVVSFDGVDDYVATHDTFGMSPLVPVTICGWIKSTVNDRARILSNWDSQQQTQILVSLNIDSKIIIYQKQKPDSLRYRYCTTVDIIHESDKWQYIVAIVYPDDRVQRCFVNGVEKAMTISAQSGVIIENCVAGGNTKMIGSDYLYNSKASKTKDVRVYNRELTAQEITDIYNYEKNFRPIDIDDGLVAYYPLANNSLDNYKNQNDLVDSGTTYDGTAVTLTGNSGSYMTLPTSLTSSFLKTDTKAHVSVWIKKQTIDDGLDNDRFYIGGGRYWSSNCNRVSLGYSGVTGVPSAQAGRMGGVDYVWVEHDTVPQNTWNLFSVNIDLSTGTLDFFINGEYVGSDTNTVGLNATGTLEWFGRVLSYDNQDYRYVGGTFSKVRLYNIHKKIEQIQVIYNTEKGDFGL